MLVPLLDWFAWHAAPAGPAGPVGPAGGAQPSPEQRGDVLVLGVNADQASELTGDLETSLKPAPAAEPVYRVYNVTFRQGFQDRVSLCESPNFLEAADFAIEFVQERAPEALEIERIEGEQQETVWTYSESRASAAELARKDLVETFGFDPTRWNPNR